MVDCYELTGDSSYIQSIFQKEDLVWREGVDLTEEVRVIAIGVIKNAEGI